MREREGRRAIQGDRQGWEFAPGSSVPEAQRVCLGCRGDERAVPGDCNLSHPLAGGRQRSAQATLGIDQLDAPGLRDTRNGKQGAVAGMAMTSLGLLAIAAFYLISVTVKGVSPDDFLKYIIGYGFGGSLISLFARVNEGLLGQFVVGLPAGDACDPGFMADHVGDNAGESFNGSASPSLTSMSKSLHIMALLAVSLIASGSLPGC